jgi:hypothetical protein
LHEGSISWWALTQSYDWSVGITITFATTASVLLSRCVYWSAPGTHSQRVQRVQRSPSSPQAPTAATTAAALMAGSPLARGQHHLVGTHSVLRLECRHHHHLRDHSVGAFVSVRVLVGSWHPLSASAACAAVTIITAGSYCGDYGGSFDGWLSPCTRAASLGGHSLSLTTGVSASPSPSRPQRRCFCLGACTGRLLTPTLGECSVCSGHHHHRRLLLLRLRRQL